MPMKIVEVKWLDATGTSGWKKVDDLIAWMEDDEKGVTWHVGYLFAEDDNYLVLVAGLQGEHLCDAIRIPKPLIISLKELTDDT
jgi:hypothetical protein